MAILQQAAQERDENNLIPPQTVKTALDQTGPTPPTTSVAQAPTPGGPYQPSDPNPLQNPPTTSPPVYPDTVPDSPAGYSDATEGQGGVDGSGTTVQDLYGAGVGDSTPTALGINTPTVETPTGAAVREVDTTGGAGTVGTPGVGAADPNAGVQAGVDAVSGVSTGETTELTAEQQVDAELVRILGQDSPLLAQARAQAAQQANARGLQNSSMAVGMSQDAMVKAALPMAQQNAAQAAARELANTANQQQAGQFSAQETARLRALEAELGTSVSVFNAEQLNQAESLAAQMRTAIAQQDANAYNQAAQQFADLQRSAEAQQADIDMAGAQQTQAEQQAYNQQTIDRVTQLNTQFLQGEQAMDLATIQGTYQQIISTNETAASLYQSYLSGMAGIMDNPDMTSSQIASSVRTMQSMLEASLRMMAELNGLDIGNTGGAPTGGGIDTSGDGQAPGQPPPPGPGPQNLPR